MQHKLVHQMLYFLPPTIVASTHAKVAFQKFKFRAWCRIGRHSLFISIAIHKFSNKIVQSSTSRIFYTKVNKLIHHEKLISTYRLQVIISLLKKIESFYFYFDFSRFPLLIFFTMICSFYLD